MLREVPARQIAGEPARRWFTSSEMDLYVWLGEDGSPSGFQLCYGKQSGEHALTWTRASGYSHMAVDGGESRPGRYKGSPILVADGSIDLQAVLEQLREEAAASVPADYLRFIEARIAGIAA